MEQYYLTKKQSYPGMQMPSADYGLRLIEEVKKLKKFLGESQ